MVWNIIGTSDIYNNEYPFYGSHFQRNNCTLLFNKELEATCNRRGIIYLSIFEQIISKDLNSIRDYYFDSVHLGQLAMPYVLRELGKLKPGLKASFGLGGTWLDILQMRVKIKIKTVLRAIKILCSQKIL